MRIILEQNNRDLLREIERLMGLLTTARQSIPAELVAYYTWCVAWCQELKRLVEEHLVLVHSKKDRVLRTVLSRTQSVTQQFQLLDQIQVRPLLRPSPSDRLCLKLIVWLHAVHPKISSVPAAFADGKVGVYPYPPVPVLYFMPCALQRGLLYLTLLFHEIGHLFFQIHNQEMVALVKDLQKCLENHLRPRVRSNDPRREREKKEQAAIRDTWVEWTEELFCDAVGLTIGGPAYLQAFSVFMRMGGRGNFYRKPDHLRNTTHPVTWIRIRLLSDRARSLGLDLEAAALETAWQKIANMLNITEEYHGYYDPRYLGDIRQTLDDMIIEADPYRFAVSDPKASLAVLAHEPVQLLNAAWDQFLANPQAYPSWEQQAIAAFLSANLVTT